VSSSQKRNLAASVRRRLLSLSRQRAEPFDLILVRYGIERLLYRLSQSPYADRFLLKGAMLFVIWSNETHRPTRDVDLLGFGPSDSDELERIFRYLCEMAIEPDGLRFNPQTVRAQPIREHSGYAGIRMTMEAVLENARIPTQVDIGFGDVVTPAPEEVEFPVLLEFPAPHLRSYPVYTVIAEKLEAMVLLGEANSRMKDFYDVWFLSRRFVFEGETLVRAIRATFDRRKTKLPTSVPLALTQEFAALKTGQWKAFVQRNKLSDEPFPTVVDAIYSFAAQPLLASSAGERFPFDWSLEGNWKAAPEE
jgi:predicted nucleotidyltransferase component of viral defense system